MLSEIFWKRIPYNDAVPNMRSMLSKLIPELNFDGKQEGPPSLPLERKWPLTLMQLFRHGLPYQNVCPCALGCFLYLVSPKIIPPPRWDFPLTSAGRGTRWWSNAHAWKKRRMIMWCGDYAVIVIRMSVSWIFAQEKSPVPLLLSKETRLRIELSDPAWYNRAWQPYREQLRMWKSFGRLVGRRWV